MIAFTLIFGYCSGCYVSLIPACVSQLGPISNVGTRLGVSGFVIPYLSLDKDGAANFPH